MEQIRKALRLYSTVLLFIWSVAWVTRLFFLFALGITVTGAGYGWIYWKGGAWSFFSENIWLKNFYKMHVQKWFICSGLLLSASLVLVSDLEWLYIGYAFGHLLYLWALGIVGTSRILENTEKAVSSICHR